MSTQRWLLNCFMRAAELGLAVMFPERSFHFFLTGRCTLPAKARPSWWLEGEIIREASEVLHGKLWGANSQFMANGLMLIFSVHFNNYRQKYNDMIKNSKDFVFKVNTCMQSSIFIMQKQNLNVTACICLMHFRKVRVLQLPPIIQEAACEVNWNPKHLPFLSMCPWNELATCRGCHPTFGLRHPRKWWEMDGWCHMAKPSKSLFSLKQLFCTFGSGMSWHSSRCQTESKSHIIKV